MRREFGTIQEVKRGSVYRVFWQQDGRKHSKRIHGTRADASRFLAKIQIKETGAGDNTTYSEYWDAVVEPSFYGLAPRTVADYKRLWATLEPLIGHVQIHRTTHRMAQQAIQKVGAPRKQEQCKALWRKICNMAIVQDGLLTTNPINAIRTQPVTHKEKVLWSVEDVTQVMNDIQGVKCEPLVLLSLSCGLRPEECFALDWEDLTFTDGYCIVNVHRTSVIVDGKPVVSERMKTKGSLRKSVCAGAFAARLEELAQGKTGAICPNGLGGRTSPCTLSRNWKVYCNRNGITYVSFENMRTNFKTLAAQALIPAELARMQMGHSGVGVAEQHYLVTTEPLLRTIADMFWALWGNG